MVVKQKNWLTHILPIVIMCNIANMSSISKIGKIGENIAANYLAKNGYKILETNFFNELGYRKGEIDIVAEDGENKELVFVEVKTRKKELYLTQPELAITRQKYRKLLKIISSYLNKNSLHGHDWRLDAIAIEVDTENRKAKLKHLKYLYYWNSNPRLWNSKQYLNSKIKTFFSNFYSPSQKTTSASLSNECFLFCFGEFHSPEERDGYFGA